MGKNFYVDHWDQWPLPVMSVPDELNSFRQERVELSVAYAGHLPYGGTKFLTVIGLLRQASASGILKKTRLLVEATSGNTGFALAMMAQHFNPSLKVKLVVKPDVPDGKRYPLTLGGTDIIFDAHPIKTVRNLGGGGWRPEGWEPALGCLNLDQYANPAGAMLHQSFTAPKILSQLRYPPTVFVAGIGTGGTITGIRNYLCSRTKVVGVLLEKGDEIPGVRDLEALQKEHQEVPLALEFLKTGESVFMSKQASYLASIWLCQVMGLAVGPSSGFAYLGALKYLQSHRKANTLDSLRDSEGRIHVVILLPDGNHAYGDRFMANLPAEYLKISTAPLPWEFPGSELW